MLATLLGLMAWASCLAGQENNPQPVPSSTVARPSVPPQAPLPLLPPPALQSPDSSTAPSPAPIDSPSGTGVGPPQLEYDPSYLYLPATAPPRRPEACRPLGRWWISPALELAWFPTPLLPRDLGLAVPDLDGSRFIGPRLLTAQRDVPTFQAGFALDGGFWLDSRNRFGLDSSFFLLGGNATIFPGYAPEMLVLFPDGVRGGAPQLLIFPPGTPLVDAFPMTYSSRYITVDVNYRHNLACADRYRLDLLIGYRHAFVQDELYFGEPPDDRSYDQHRDNRLAASNPFHGGQLGLAGEYRGGPWFVTGAVKVAWGVVAPKIEATGLFLDTYARTSGGLWQRLPALDNPLAERFAVMPMLRLTVGRQFGNHLRVYAGYNFYYLSRVVRLAEALNLTVPPRLADVWIQSITLGLEARF
ncbi:MAG: BBP7 family outer membrane beta-barrel protein [Gemmataceae bacterium]|nr:BBP7 family outer membrane beta-barrel protein [Gemmataceae bacterium]